MNCIKFGVCHLAAHLWNCLWCEDKVDHQSFGNKERDRAVSICGTTIITIQPWHETLHHLSTATIAHCAWCCYRCHTCVFISLRTTIATFFFHIVAHFLQTGHELQSLASLIFLCTVPDVASTHLEKYILASHCLSNKVVVRNAWRVVSVCFST